MATGPWHGGEAGRSRPVFRKRRPRSKPSIISSDIYTGVANAWNNPIDNPNLPNILIIGDSISIGYTDFVRNELKNIADVYRIPGNAMSTYYAVRNSMRWLNDRKWDVIHFNIGLWDIEYNFPSNIENGTIMTTESEYKKQLETVVNNLKTSNAKLIWCSTTPVPKGTVNRNQGDEIKYNYIAKEIMDKNNIITNDLYTYAFNNIENIQLPKHVHFTEKGSKFLALQVSKEIKKQLQ